MKEKILAYLRLHGASSSESIQSELKISQPTASRHLNSLSDEIVGLGRGRSIRYAVAEPIGDSAAQQPIWQIGENGERVQLGVLSFLEKSQIHIQAHGVNELYSSIPRNPLPWYLSSLRAQGFIGRIIAKGLESKGVGANPETWDANAILIAAINTSDAPGNLLLGEMHPTDTHSHIPSIEPGLFLDHFRQILQFGRLIGNTDMHSGNASLYARGATLKDVLKGQFHLAPAYDMLPMRWRPDPMVGTVDYELFDVDISQADPLARTAAKDFWVSLSKHVRVSPGLRVIASEMADRF